MSLSNNKPDTGIKDPKFQEFAAGSFEISNSPSAPEAPGNTFESSYDGSEELGAFQLMSLYPEGEKAKGLIEEAKAKVAIIEGKAYEKGFAQGEKDGFEKGAQKLEKLLDQFQSILQDMINYKQEFVKKYEKEMLHLISTIAEKVVHGAVKVDNRIVREAIIEAFSLASDSSKVTVRVNPEEVEYVKEIRPEFFDRISELKSITIESDPSISLGGCFMETAFGNVDTRIETQLEKISEAVEKVFEQESEIA